MALAPVQRIIDGAQIQLPGAIQGAMRLEFFNVMKEFFQRTNSWIECIQVPATPGVTTYTLPQFDPGNVERLMFLEGQTSPGPNGGSSCGPPQQGYLVRPGSEAVLKIPLPPSSAQTWTAYVVMTVADPTDNEGMPHFPEWVAEKYHSELMSGLIARMAAHPNKPYSNMSLAAFHGRIFQDMLNMAKAEARQGYVFSGQRWGFPQTFNTFTQRLWR